MFEIQISQVDGKVQMSCRADKAIEPIVNKALHRLAVVLEWHIELFVFTGLLKHIIDQ